MSRLAIALAPLALLSAPVQAENYYVRNQSEYAHALKQIRAGDVIILANGEWRDFDLVITGKGRKDKPITLISEEAGKVFLTGQSSLRIGGEHILVTGLVFKDGYSPRGEVISFRRSKEDQSRNSRVTEVVIDNFNQPDRTVSDYWVGIYGRNNRFDHNHLVGKSNAGVTLAVRLDSAESRNNGHRIDHNYFGPRPVLGSNGGETIRIGTSQYSMHQSNTLVENNVFDRCDGEVEIISSKSGGNVFRGNLFLRSRGALTLRHGDGNLVERNVFLGHGKDHTGGIRVINRNQTVRGNYMEGLRGTGTASALTVMNGVPNSPLNRYVQVDNALIERNTVVDSARVTLGAGSDEERSAVPVNSAFRANLFAKRETGSMFRVEDDIRGIAFENNVLVGEAEKPPAPPMRMADAEMIRAANGLLYPSDPALANVGAPRDLKVMQLSAVGVTWYAKPGGDVQFGSGQARSVEPGDDKLAAAVAAAQPGDILQLRPGDYVVDRAIAIDKTITLAGPAEGAAKAVVRFTRPSLFELREGGNLALRKLEIDGSLAPDSVGNAVIRTSSFPIQSNMRIELDGVDVRNLAVNKAFSVLTLGKGVLAQRVTVRNSRFTGISGSIVSAASETDDYGRYNVEYLDLIDSEFVDIGGPAAAVYRGGKDESTFGPHVTISGNRIKNVGRGAVGDAAASLSFHGVQTARLSGNDFENSAPVRIVHTVGTPSTIVVGNSFDGTPLPIVEEAVFRGPPRVEFSNNRAGGKVVR